MRTARTLRVLALLLAGAALWPARAQAWPAFPDQALPEAPPATPPVTPPVRPMDVPVEVAQAASAARCTIFEIRASHDKGGIAPELAPLERKLRRPPFSSWDTFKLLAKHDEQVEYKKASSMKLATGGKMSVLYRDRIKLQGKKPRLRLQVDIKDKAGHATLQTSVVVDSGDYWLIGGEPFGDDGTYVLAISCTVP